MTEEYTIEDLMRGYDIRQVCIDCKYLHTYYDYYPDCNDEEFQFWGCWEEHDVSQYSAEYEPMICPDKEKGDNDVYDEKNSRKWMEKQKNKVTQWITENVCPYCEEHYIEPTYPNCKGCVSETLESYLQKKLGKAFKLELYDPFFRR